MEAQSTPAPFALGPENPVPGRIDWLKPVRMKGTNHVAVRVLAIDYSLRQPVVISREGEVWSYHLDGSFFYDRKPCGNDLENVPEPVSAPQGVAHG